MTKEQTNSYGVMTPMDPMEPSMQGEEANLVRMETHLILH